MTKIILEVDERVIEKTLHLAEARETTLDALFAEWLEALVRRERLADEAKAAVAEIRRSTKTNGRKFTRDEMNAR